MSKTWALTRILFKNGTGGLSKKGKGRGRLTQTALIAILLVALLPLMSAVGGLVAMMYDSLAPVGQEGAILGLGLAMGSLIVFMFGIFYVITVFYFSQDVEHLLPLPLKPAQIVTAKFLTALIYEYLTLIILFAPLFGVYGFKDGAGPLFYVYAVVIYASLPIVPLVLASVIAMIIMSFAGVARNKDRFRMIGGIVAVVLSFGLNTFIQRTLNKTTKPEQIQDMIVGGHNSFVEFTTRSFPSVKLAANALLKETELAGLAWLVLFVALSALFYVAFALLAGRFYFKGVMGISETGARRIRLTGSQLDKQTLQRTALSSLIVKELRILLRTPSYFLNCVLMAFLWPVLMMIPIMTQPGFKDMLGSTRTLFDSAGSSAIVPAIGVALILFVSGANAAAPTSISREGAGFFISKYLPVPHRTMIAAKVASGFLITMTGALLLLLVALFRLRLPLPFVLTMVPIACAATLFTCLTGLVVDLLMPKLVWENEQKAVKQNTNGLVNLLISIASAALLFFLVNWLGLGLWAAAAVLLVALALADILLIRLLGTKGEAWFGKIEV